MKGLGGKLLGDVEHFSFEQRIFHFAMLIAVGMTAFGTAMDLYYRANIVYDIVFQLCWLVTYWFSRFKDRFLPVSTVSMGIFVFAFIPLNWITSGGSSSILPYYSIIFIAITCVILRGRFRVAMVCSILAMELLLIGYDAWHAGSPMAHLQNNMRFFDLAIHLFVILAAMAILLIVYSNTYLKEKARSEDYARAIGEHYRQQLYYMENLEQLIYRLKADRHDFNNHLGAIYGLLESGEAERARSYAAQLVKNAQEYQNVVNIPYPTLRAVLNYKLSAIRESGVELRLGIDMPEGLKLEEFDLAVILGNLLDNAAEACAGVGKGSGYISLSLQYKPDYLIIHMENPTAGRSALGGQNRTTKPDAENHGFGLKNIEYLVGKHNGLMKIEPGNGAFTVDIALLMP